MHIAHLLIHNEFLRIGRKITLEIVLVNDYCFLVNGNETLDKTAKDILLLKLRFLDLSREYSPFLELVGFCHVHMFSAIVPYLRQINSFHVPSS